MKNATPPENIKYSVKKCFPELFGIKKYENEVKENNSKWKNDFSALMEESYKYIKPLSFIFIFN